MPDGVHLKSHSQSIMRAVMEQEGISRAGLAHRSGCSKSFIGHLLAGRRDGCSEELAARIARSLGVAPRILFERPK